MRIHALLSFYDEPIEGLVMAITSLKMAGVDHLVALDGAYALYPDAKAASHPNQHAAIALTCRELDIACTLHVPAEPWAGNEPEKRTALFALGWALADPGDWFMVHDADMVITRWPDDTRERLERSDLQAAKVEILDTVALRINQRDLPPFFDFCGMFRAQPITVGPHHAQYQAADGSYLWVGNGSDEPVPTLDLTDVRVEHRPDRRPEERQQSKAVYYTNRDATRNERGTCRCGQPAVRLVATGWRLTHIAPVADWQEACEHCAPRLEKVGRRQMRQLSTKLERRGNPRLDPDMVTLENRNGKAPEGMAVK